MRVHSWRSASWNRVYKESGFNRPIKPDDDEKINLNKTKYRNQIAKVALAIRDIITAIEHPGQKTEGILKEIVNVKPEKAIEIDPDYADAYLGIADVWLSSVLWSFATPDEATPIAKSNVAKAFKLDSTSSEVYTFLAAIQMNFDWNFKSAEKYIKKAISLNPNNPDAHTMYEGLLRVFGHSKESLEQYEMVLKLDPMNKDWNSGYGYTLYCAGRNNEAIKVFKEVLKIDPGNIVA